MIAPAVKRTIHSRQAFCIWRAVMLSRWTWLYQMSFDFTCSALSKNPDWCRRPWRSLHGCFFHLVFFSWNRSCWYSCFVCWRSKRPWSWWHCWCTCFFFDNSNNCSWRLWRNESRRCCRGNRWDWWHGRRRWSPYLCCCNSIWWPSAFSFGRNDRSRFLRFLCFQRMDCG